MTRNQQIISAMALAGAFLVTQALLIGAAHKAVSYDWEASKRYANQQIARILHPEIAQAQTAAKTKTVKPLIQPNTDYIDLSSQATSVPETPKRQ